MKKPKNNKTGYEATKRLRHRDPQSRGGRARDKENRTFTALQHAFHLPRYLQSIEVKNYSEDTISNRYADLVTFTDWAENRSLNTPESITKLHLESYQRHIWRHRKHNGKPLAISSQRKRLGVVKDLFKYLTKNNHIPANPASELELPRAEKRLPQQALSHTEIKTILNQPDITDPLGIRDRAILELLYSTGIRRTELTNLEITDLNQERQTLQIIQGKGNKDRVVPVGKSTLKWLEKYLDEVRRLLARPAGDREGAQALEKKPFSSPHTAKNSTPMSSAAKSPNTSSKPKLDAQEAAIYSATPAPPTCSKEELTSASSSNF